MSVEIRDERPPYISFHRVAVEDAEASRAAGHYVAKDVDMVHVTPAYTKDVFKNNAAAWFGSKENDVANGRFPQRWLEEYKAQYAAWQRGQELPLNGVPVKGWGVISPAMQETLIRLRVLTVEDVAAMNSDGVKMIGPGAIDLKNKAIAWLKELKEKGGNTMEMAALKSENELLKGSVETLQRQVKALMQKLGSDEPASDTHTPNGAIAASDILEEDPRAAYEKKFGKPPHHRMKEETIVAALKG